MVFATNGTLVVSVVAAACICVVPRSATGQYYYQPSPDFYRNDTAEGTVVGGALGAITGAIVGGRKDRGEGALIGAGVGALTGNLLGRQKDQRDAQQTALGAATVAQANQQAAQRAVTNYDLVSMTRARVSDELIISTLRARGARLDLSPRSLIELKEIGVSDRVVIAAQEMISGSPYVPATPVRAIMAPPPPTSIYVAPGPRRVYHYPRYYPYRPHHHHHGSRIHYRVSF